VKLNELFTKNYDYLNTVAKRITRSRDHRMGPDLLNSTYLVVFEKHEKGLYIPEDGEEFIKWFSKCMKNYFTWPNSEFNKYYKDAEISLDRNYHQTGQMKPNDGESLRHDLQLLDEDAHKNIEIFVEQANDFTKELIDISSSLGRTKTLKYIELVDFKRTLPTHESILFELYFEKELSTRKIADLYSIDGNTMNYQSVNGMVNKIKLKIKEYQWTQSIS
jgi:hypothetical protein